MALGLCLASLTLYLVHFACFRDVQYLWLSVLTNLAFLPISVLLVTLVIDRLLSARERALRREKLRMLVSVFFSSLGNELLGILFRCDANVTGGWHDQAGRGHVEDEMVPAHAHGERGHGTQPFRSLAAHPGRVEVVVACRCHEVCVEQADLEQLRGLLVHKLDILLRLLENPSLHEHESFAELLRAVFHLEEELSLKDDLRRIPASDHEHLRADVNRCYGLLVREWNDYLDYLEANYPYLFSLALRTNPLCICTPPAEGREGARGGQGGMRVYCVPALAGLAANLLPGRQGRCRAPWPVVESQ